jgi:hypothetical protein
MAKIKEINLITVHQNHLFCLLEMYNKNVTATLLAQDYFSVLY